MTQLETDTKPVAQRFAAVEIGEIRAQLVTVESARIASNHGKPYDDYVREQHKLFRMFDPLHVRHQAAVSAFVALADSIPAQIEAAVEAEREACASLVDAGNKMANLLYNFAQYKLPGTVAAMVDAREQWDAATSAIRSRGEAVK